MNRSARAVVFFACALFLLPVCLLSQQVSLTIFHTNDTHGHLRPFSYPTDVPSGSDIAGLAYRTDIGGIARRAGLVNQLRAELEKQGTTVWLVDVGDFSDGTPFSTEYHGEADVMAMNAAGYTFGALGNHEFNQPISRLKSIIGMFRYPVLCANAVENSTGRLLTQASEIRSVGPLRIGIFGVVTVSTSDYPAAREGITINGEIETCRRMVKTLRPEADIVIALSHSGDKVDEEIAKVVPGIDIIVGGHSHSRLLSGAFVRHSDELKAQDVNGTVIVQAYQWGGELGRLDLLFARDSGNTWHTIRYNANLLSVNHEAPEDKRVAEVVERYWKPISARYGEIIGKAAGDFVERGDDLAPYNLMADSIRETLGTDIELENLGGVRAPLVKGAITRGDLIDMDPFDNTIVTFNISGRRLRQILQSQRPAVSGLRYRIENDSVTQVTVGGRPLRDDHIYTGSANSYFARTAMKGIRTKNTGKLRLEVLINYIRKKGTVYPVFDGRRVIIS